MMVNFWCENRRATIIVPPFYGFKVKAEALKNLLVDFVAVLY